MKEFIIQKLNDVADIFSGYAFKSSDMTDSGIPLLKIANIQDHTVIKATSNYLPLRFKDKKFEKFILRQNDVLVAMTGAGSVGKIGRMHSTDTTYFVNQRVGIIRINEKECDPKFVYYQLCQPQYEDTLYSIGIGAGQPNVSPKDVGNLDIYLPTIEVQKRVSFLLSSYDNLIENNNQRINILEEMVQRLYREWFVHFRFPGHENVKLIESEFGMIPEGWYSGIVSDICDKIFSGGTPTTSIDEYWNGDLPWLSSGETRNSVIVKTEKTITEKGVLNSSTRKANEGDVVIASAGQGKTRGQTSFLLIDTYINQSVIALKGKPKYPEYLYLNIKSRYGELRNASDSSSIRGSITTALMGTLKIIVPDIITLRLFSEMASRYIKEIGVLNRKNIVLTKTRDLLLPRLISGDIDVSRIDIPVSEVNS